MFDALKSAFSRSMKEATLDSLHAKVMMADRDLRITYVNPSLRDFLSKAQAEIKTELPHFNVTTLVGSKIDVFHKRPAHQHDMLGRLSTHHAATIRIGSRAFDLRVEPLSRKGRRIGFVVEWTDAGERLLNLDYAAQIAAIGRSQAVIAFSVTGHILTANQTFLQTFGYRLDEIVGRHHGMFVDDEFRESREYAEFWNTLGKGESIVAEYRRRGKDGREIWVHGSYNPIFDADNRITKIVKFATDVTRRRQAVAEIGVALTRLASGELNQRLETPLIPELDKLRLDLNHALDMLGQAMRQVDRCSSAIHRGTGEIQGSSDELSRRTEQQAASLERTAAALDEITATVRATSDNSRHASEVVGRATRNASRSGTVVRQTVGAMRAIKDSSDRIGPIIGVIDEIAFQTNLLALNAGVEAARAGDAGRGFAVVASEVRALAQRSAEAAREIKGLILDSGNRVAEGVALVDETGETLNRIIEEVDEINGIVSTIATSAQEQAAGIQDINTAINQMDQVTQQNAAMVEEATAATHALVDQAAELADLVGRFSLSRADGVAAPAPSSVRSAAILPRPTATAALPTRHRAPQPAPVPAGA